MKERIYITGPVKDRGSEWLEEFALAKGQLQNLGFENVVTAAEQIPHGDYRHLEGAEALCLRMREMHRSQANILLYLAGWEGDVDSKREVNRSRQEGKQKIMMCSSFIKTNSTVKI